MNDVERDVKKETRLEMTPMIDVTFLLLIFFLCTIRFKILEGKIPAYLPKGVGVNPNPIEKELVVTTVDVRRTAPANVENPLWVWREDQVDIRVQGKKMAGLEQFQATMGGLRRSDPDAKIKLHPGSGCLYIDCIKVVNECLRANVTNVTFAGTPIDG